MTEQLATPKQCRPGELWFPGLHLDEEYTVPSNEELANLWQDYSGRADAQATNGVYGVYSRPTDVVTAVASIDLCEVVRDTVVSLDNATGLALGRRCKYSADTWFEAKEKGLDYERSVVVSVVRAVMDSGLIKPVEDIESIRSTLRSWRKLGIFCVANTSTLPGCERGTITHTLKRDLEDCFDGLVLPRNHDGKGPMTKARALQTISEEAGIDLGNIPFVHIDDAEHHITGFQTSYADNPRLRLFTPLNGDNGTISADLHCATPLDAFMSADEYFRQQGVIQ